MAKKKIKKEAAKKEAAPRNDAIGQLAARIPRTKMRAFRLECFKRGVTVQSVIEDAVDAFIAKAGS